MMDQRPPTQDKSMRSMVSDAMKKRLELLLDPPKKPEVEKRPKNNLWIAYIAFNVLLAFLDLITAITVAAVTLWFYGVLVFAAGYGPLLLWEFLFVRPYASQTQKNISIGGAIVGAVSTIGVAVLVGILNVIQINSIVGAGAIEVVIVVSLVVLTAIHVILFGSYYFTDHGFKREQTYATSLANHDDVKRAVRQAKGIARELLALGEELEEEQKSGRGSLVGLSLKKLGQQNLLEEEEFVEKAGSNGNRPS